MLSYYQGALKRSSQPLTSPVELRLWGSVRQAVQQQNKL